MGIRISVSDLDLSDGNLGTLGSTTEQVALTSITISGSESLSTRTGNYSVVYNPSNTTQKGVTWSITSGSNLATISSNGTLTINSDINEGSVTIKATSTKNSAITATKTIAISIAEETPDEPATETPLLTITNQAFSERTDYDTITPNASGSDWTSWQMAIKPTFDETESTSARFVSCYESTTPNYYGWFIGRWKETGVIDGYCVSHTNSSGVHQYISFERGDIIFLKRENGKLYGCVGATNYSNNNWTDLGAIYIQSSPLTIAKNSYSLCTCSLVMYKGLTKDISSEIS